jgi:hypothetical protein
MKRGEVSFFIETQALERHSGHFRPKSRANAGV